jgi:hypothetical protein
MQGIGREVALLFSKEGAKVVISECVLFISPKTMLVLKIALTALTPSVLNLWMQKSKLKVEIVCPLQVTLEPMISQRK